ncbi:MAG: hypothetical protein WC480_02685 [Patescibacteria group bacterium]
MSSGDVFKEANLAPLAPESGKLEELNQPEVAPVPREAGLELTQEQKDQLEKARAADASAKVESEGIAQKIVKTVKPHADLDEQLTEAEQPMLKKVEDILAEDLADTYKNLPPEKQQQFKIEGEKTASKIVVLLRAVKIKSQLVFKLIKTWLKLIPGVNKFFLLQEAKIKTDKIVDFEMIKRGGDQNQDR